MNKQDSTKVPPDGKWGWMIVLAYALNGISTTAMLQGFGLIFKDTFPLFGFTGTKSAVIINTNLASGMILGLANGPLLRTFGYRKVAIIGSLIYTIGVIMTAFSKSFATIIIFYGLFASWGTCITLSAFSYALNSYFTTKKGRAMSIAVTIIGLGPIIVPQITTFLLSYYGTEGTILLFGAFSLHSLVGSTLLQPLKWHTKDVNKSTSVKEESIKNKEENDIIDEKSSGFPNDANPKISRSDVSNVKRRGTTTNTSIDQDSEIGSIYGIDVPTARQMSETLNASSQEDEPDIYKLTENDQEEKELLKNQFRKDKSTDTINLSSSFTIFEEKPVKKYSSTNGFEKNNYDIQNTMEDDLLLQKNEGRTMSNRKIDKNEELEKETTRIRIFNSIAKLFDLDLLRDPIYVNIMLGQSAAIFAEINFSQFTPFILMDMKLSTEQIASVMSTIASVDLVFRTLAPFIAQWLRQPPRIMYLLSLCLLIISRTSLLFANGFIQVVAVAIGLGIAKGIRTVYMFLVIPSYVPIHRLPNASGIQMIVNGLMFLLAGPMFGVIRDNIGSYTPCIIMMNSVTALVVIMWSVEMLILQRRKVQKEREQQGNF